MRVIRSRAWGLALLAILAPAFATPSADPPGPDTSAERIAALVRQLGDDEYARREMAGTELAAIGEKALPELRAAATDANPEVRFRARQAVRAILSAIRKSKSTGMELVLVSLGEFQMGSPKTEGYRRPDETVHRVRITRHFLIGAREVTQDEYRKVMKASPSWFSATGQGKDKVAGQDTGQFPVENVTWYDAAEFCNRLSKLDGYEPHYKLEGVERDEDTIRVAKVTVLGGTGYRLPSEAEWEYACRAGSPRPFSFGWQNTGREANLKPGPAAGGYGGTPTWASLGRTATVGSYKPNGWGLSDMHGNAAEWCGDWYDKDYYENSPTDDPRGPETGTHRVLRGGSWLLPEGSCRSATRFFLAPGESNYYAGFRVARAP